MLGRLRPLLAAALWAHSIFAQEKPGGGVSYFREVRPLIQRNCQGCHQPAMKMGNLDLTTHDGAKGASAKIVAYLTGERKPQMPLGQPPLPADQVDVFRRWIAAGAGDDTPAEARETISLDKPPVYYNPPVINAVAWSPDGALLAISGYREIVLHKMDGSGIAARLLGVSDRIQSLAFTKDGKTLIAAGGTPARFGEVQFWNVGTGKLTRSVMLSNDTLFGMSLSADGSHIAVGCTDNSLRLIDVASGKETARIPHHENWVLGTVFGVDGKRIVSVGRDRAAKLTDATNGQFIENVNLLRGELLAIARHPSRDLVVIGGEERIPYYYRMDRPRVMKIADDTTLIRKLDRQNGSVLALAFSPDGLRIAVAGAGPEVNLYLTETGERALSLKGHKAGIYTVAFSPDGKQIATAGFDGTVRLYDTATGALNRAFVPVPVEKRLVSER